MVDGVPSLPVVGSGSDVGDEAEAEAVDVSAAHHDRFDPALLATTTVRGRACRAFDEIEDIAHLVDPGKGLFVGRSGALAPPRRRLVSLALDDPGEVVVGDEPVLAGDECVGRVAAAAVSHAEDVSLALAAVPPALAAEGTALAVEYFGRRLPARVVVREVR
jgi:hypothetical protein